ncbi:hypothetical protein BDV41DRAFT_580028 [Aspergillus transmontanensis]|uniref:Uncharacterized protein n=1 Tax=Aspergillus transmontanensis TaxID=1034304 RepID=A0A5N6VS17_9EURO|nr:hypothetical protein BDV41DRAFT_580028 [Aspergillus transmontanensis]
MGLIEDFFEDDSILATPVDRFVLDDKNNCEFRLVPNVPPTDDNTSWERYGSTQNTSQYTLAAILVQMDNIKKNGGDLNQAGSMTGPPLKWALYEYEPSSVDLYKASSSFTKNAGSPFSSEDNDLRDEISQFLSGHDHQEIIGQLNLQSEEFITYLIDSVRNKLESDDTQEDVVEPIVMMAVLDFSADLVDSPDLLAMYTIQISCRLVTEDDDNNNELMKEIRLDTRLSTVEVDQERWADLREENEEDATRAFDLSEKFISQYGP